MMQGDRKDGRKRARRILLCASGGFIVYSLPRIILHLLHHFADDVQVVLSRAAAKLVSPHAVEVASRNRVFIEMDDTGDGVFVPHIELGRNVDLVLVFPATVNILSKVANGITDELITALIIATEAPVLFMPESNPAMIHHPAVQRNIERLRADGYLVLPQIAGPEVATREDMERLGDNFPIPSLLLQMSAVLADPKSGGMARRNPAKS
ncbi:MAG TPA: flavoprotein [Bradyrhizobium sp.]|uniref:flavoprotein n=1 Tax=Bradyrhizobium sp. TaxID=376 RepID=UPI002C20F549|nr:flavoprotein [Bradyrhizobium sp.]HTB04938.1 flavoprotein [Bradyrhizobium sp.]